MKIVRNDCFGGFSLSPLAVMEYAKLKGIKLFAYTDINYWRTLKRLDTLEEMENACICYYTTKDCGEKCDSNDIEDGYFSDREIERTDACLIEIVERLGKKANGCCADLIVVEIPDDIEWEISDYDGLESIEEKHRSW